MLPRWDELSDDERDVISIVIEMRAKPFYRAEAETAARLAYTAVRLLMQQRGEVTTDAEGSSTVGKQRRVSKGYRHGVAVATPPPATVIRLRMDDGRVLLTDDVVRELRSHGFDIVPYLGETS